MRVLLFGTANSDNNVQPAAPSSSTTLNVPAIPVEASDKLLDLPQANVITIKSPAAAGVMVGPNELASVAVPEEANGVPEVDTVMLC